MKNFLPDQVPKLYNFSMLNSTEHEISIAHKKQNTEKWRIFSFSVSQASRL